MAWQDLESELHDLFAIEHGVFETTWASGARRRALDGFAVRPVGSHTRRHDQVSVDEAASWRPKSAVQKTHERRLVRQARAGRFDAEKIVRVTEPTDVDALRRALMMARSRTEK